MRILITGIHSLLGSGLLELRPENFTIFGAYHKLNPNILNTPNINLMNLDITSARLAKKVCQKIKPDVLIHAAALSDVDWCQKHQKEAFRTNVGGLKNMIEAVKPYKTKVVLISTNAVFDGSSAPYKESDIPNPTSFYGKTKYQGELLIRSSGLSFAIIRLMTMYGWHPKKTRLNPATWTIKQLKRGREIYMVDDSFINPLFNIAAAKAIYTAIKKSYRGILHIAGATKVSRYKFAREIAKTFKLPMQLVLPVKSSFFSNITPRPKDTTYDTSNMEKILSMYPLSLREGLSQMKNSYDSA